MKKPWTEDPVKIDAMLNEVDEQFCEACSVLDEDAGSYCDDCCMLADFRTSLRTNRRWLSRYRMRVSGTPSGLRRGVDV